MTKKYFHLYFLCVTLVTFLSNLSAQQSELIKYLNALKTVEFDESKKTIKQLSIQGTYSYILDSYESPIGQIFNTDIPGVKGYKAIIKSRGKDVKGNTVDDRFLVVLYYDKIKLKWIVVDFRTAADPCSEANLSKRDIDKGDFYSDKQYVYRNLGYWQMMCGKIKNAKMAFVLANKEAEKNGDKEFSMNYLSAIKAIE